MKNFQACKKLILTESLKQCRDPIVISCDSIWPITVFKISFGEVGYTLVFRVVKRDFQHYVQLYTSKINILKILMHFCACLPLKSVFVSNLSIASRISSKEM